MEGSDLSGNSAGGEVGGATDALHHRLLEGVLLRLARLPDAAHFILRGGMLLRRWFPRRADDLDLTA